MLAKPTQLLLCFVFLSLTKLSFGKVQPSQLEPFESKIKDSQDPSLGGIQLETLDSNPLDSNPQDSQTVTQIDYVSLALQVIHKENSSLGLTTTLDLYEFDQIFIIQRHVDSISVELLQVYLHFTVKATCKPNAGDCADQMRYCRTHFCLNHTDIEDDVCNCEPLSDMFDGAFDAEDDLELPSTAEKKTHFEPGTQKTQNSKNPIENGLKSLLETDNDHSFHDTTDSQVVLGNKNAQKSKDNVGPLIMMISPNVDDPSVGKDLKPLSAGSENPTKLKHDLQPFSSLKESNNRPQKTKENVGAQNIVGPEPNDPAMQKELESILGLDDLQQLIPQLEDEDYHKKHTMEDKKQPTKDRTEDENMSPQNINFLNVANSLVDSLNAINPNNNNLTLGKLLNVQHHLEAAKPTYTVTIECDYPSHGRVVCDVTCSIQPWYSPPQILDYFCQRESSGRHRPTNNRSSSKAGNPPAKDTASFNRNIPEKKTAVSNGNHAVKNPGKKDGKTKNEGTNQKTATPCRDPNQVKLIAEFVMIQMDEIDLDDYRRVLLNVTNVREELTVDGSGLQYSLSMLMVSTDCLETNSLEDMDDSESCLDSLVNPVCPQQYCDVNCVRSLTSDDGPRLVSSECRPASVPDSNVGNVRF